MVDCLRQCPLWTKYLTTISSVMALPGSQCLATLAGIFCAPAFMVLGAEIYFLRNQKVACFMAFKI